MGPLFFEARGLAEILRLFAWTSGKWVSRPSTQANNRACWVWHTAHLPQIEPTATFCSIAYSDDISIGVLSPLFRRAVVEACSLGRRVLAAAKAREGFFFLRGPHTSKGTRHTDLAEGYEGI